MYTTKAYDPESWGICGITTSNEYAPYTNKKRVNNTGLFYGCQVTYTYKGKEYTSWASTGEMYTEGEGEIVGAYVFIKATSASVSAPIITAGPSIFSATADALRWGTL